MTRLTFTASAALLLMTLNVASAQAGSLRVVGEPEDPRPTDIHCSSSGNVSVNVPWTCNDQFARDCKRLGGTLSGPQPWGGQTCFEPTSAARGTPALRLLSVKP